MLSQLPNSSFQPTSAKLQLTRVASESLTKAIKQRQVKVKKRFALLSLCSALRRYTLIIHHAPHDLRRPSTKRTQTQM